MDSCARCGHSLWLHSMDLYPDRYEYCHDSQCGCAGFVEGKN